MIAGECDGRTVWAIAAAMTAAVALGSTAPATAPRLQVGVLGDGYIAAEATSSGWRVVELTADGSPRAEHALATGGADARFVGSVVGPTAGVLVDHRVEFVRATDGEPLGAFGTGVRALCDGAASNALRYGVAWIQDDDRVWVLHGTTASVADGEIGAARAGAKTWCGVASAGRNLMLMWRDGKRMYFNTCTAKSCNGAVASLALAARVALLGFGCVENGCLIATRVPGAGAELQLVTAAGGVKWRKPLDTAATEVSIVGAGDDAFAVGYPGAVIGVDRKGRTAPLWRGDGAPAVAWARGRVLVAARTAGALATSTIAYP